MRGRGILFVCSLMLAMAAPAPPSRAQQSQDKIWCVNKDKQFSPDLQIGGCTALIQAGKENSKNLAAAFNNRGNTYNRKGQYDRAIEDYNQALRLDPKSATAFSNRGVAYERKGQYDRAIEDYSQVIRLDPQNAAAFNSRCWERAIVGRELREALADCNESLRLKPNDADTLDSRGFVYIKLGQFDPAIADYSAAVAANPKAASALYGRGYATRKKGDASGTDDIAAAKAIQPDIADVYAKNGVK
jgi:tetratricopeptide (TPR) repeat protein